MRASFVFYSIFMIYGGGVEMLQVKVQQGWLEGEQLVPVTGEGHYYSFKGIPYAAPPVGKLRFKAPQPPLPWKRLRNATQHGPICVQYNVFTNELLAGSEDCLFLNVYSPDLNPGTPLPVMFYIHGGGYESDSGNVDNYGPDFLTQHGVVLVTINYRLEVLGFLSLDTAEVPGNAGMKDQVVALKWVKRNILQFGGDPDNITVFGQSAGGASAIYHTISPLSRGLFKRTISMSGVPFCDWSLAYEPRRRAFALGKELGKNTNNVSELLEFLQSLPAERLVNVSPCVLTSEEITGNVLKMFHFTPVVEKDFGQENFLTEDPFEAIKNGRFSDKDLLIGHTSEEGIGDMVSFENKFLPTYSKYAEMVVPRKILYKNTPNEILEISDLIREHYFGHKHINKDTLRELLNYINDSTYNYDIYRYIKLFSRMSKHKTYVYRFSGASNRNVYGKVGAKYNLTGASHLDDTAYLFDPKNANLTISKNSKEYKMVQQTCALFANFATFGNPTPASHLGVVWRAYNNETESYMDIGEKLTPGNALDADAANFWNTVFHKAGIEF